MKKLFALLSIGLLFTAVHSKQKMKWTWIS